MSLFRPLAVALPAVGLVFVLAASRSHAGLDDRVPNDANAIILLDVDQIMASPLAQKENWRADREKSAAAGLTILPVSATSFLMAAKMDLEFMRAIWEIALADVNYEPSIPQIAAKWMGEVDRISGRSAAILQDDSYIVKLGKRKIAAMRPANRQNVARWLAQTDSTSGHQLSPYITEALEYHKKLGTPIVMAIDMEESIPLDRIKKQLTQFESLKGKDVDLDQLAETLASIRGVTLGLNVKDNVSGALIIDFKQNVDALKGMAKPVLLEALSRRSAMIDEFKDWKETVEDQRVRISGRLYRSGLQRILSFLDTPASLHEHMPSPGEMPDEEMTAKLSSQQYFHSVTGLVDDLKDKPKQTMGQVGMWFQKYAKKIDGLPLLHVDPVLLDYGKFVSTKFRDASSVLRGVGGRSRVRGMNATQQQSSYGRWGSTGSYEVSGFALGNVSYTGAGQSSADRAAAQERATIRTEERVEGASSARDIMQDVQDATADVRRQMTEKYEAEF